MRYCQNCGRQIIGQTLFCENCEKHFRLQECSMRKEKNSKNSKYILILGYLLVLSVIAIGFIVGRGYKVYDNGRAAASNCNYSFEQEYGCEQIEEMFDGCIHKYEGWYGLSWENTYSLYQKTDLTREQFEAFCQVQFGTGENYSTWTEKEYVEFISKFSTYGPGRQHDYVWIVLEGDIVFIEFAPTNNVENYDDVCPKVLAMCVFLLLLPVLCWLPVRIRSQNKRK